MTEGKKVRLLYASSAPLPSKFANRLQITKMSEALNKVCYFQLLLSTMKVSKEEVFKYYHVTSPFEIIELGRAPVHLRSILYSLKIAREVRKFDPDWIMLREAPLALFLRFLLPRRFKMVFEMHDFPETKKVFHKFFLRRMDKIISTNKWKAEKMSRDFGISINNILFVPNGVDLSDFNFSMDIIQARKEIGLLTNSRIVLYTGQMFSWKGVQVLLDSAKFLPTNISIVFVGGTKSDHARLLAGNKIPKNVKMLQQVSHDRISLYLKSADVLVLPNTAKEDISKYSTSPIKLFEYMASDRPIVASRLPSIEEIVSDSDVLFFDPDNPKDLANKIIKLISEEKLGDSLVLSSKRRVNDYTWDKRAEKVLDFLTN